MKRFVCRLEEAKQALAESREKLERQNQQLSDYEAEMNMLRRREELLECDRQIYKKTLARLQDALNRARIVSIHFLPFFFPRSVSLSLLLFPCSLSLLLVIIYISDSLLLITKCHSHHPYNIQKDNVFNNID